MNISKVNLNLLIALDALLSERNVTRAGQKVFITQPAMSNALKQLRDIFKDELLVMTGRTMQLTLRAQQIQPLLKQWLSQAQTILKPEIFDPSSCQRRFILGMEEYTNFILLPDLYAYLSQYAPQVELQIKHVPFFKDKSMLDAQEIELAVGLFNPADELLNLQYERLFSEKVVCIGSKKNPVFKKKLTLKNYIAAAHVSLATNHPSPALLIDEALKKLGHQRHIVLRLAHIVPALYTIAKSNLIATVPQGVANEAARLLDLAIQPCPVNLPAITFLQAWHPLKHSDLGHCWLRNVVKMIAQKPLSPSGL